MLVDEVEVVVGKGIDQMLIIEQSIPKPCGEKIDNRFKQDT